MFSFGIYFTVFGYYMYVSIVAGSDELVIDPMSIFVDPNLYRFCWKPIGVSMYKDTKFVHKITNIGGYPNIDKKQNWLKIIQDNQFDKETLCIEHRDKTDSYLIPLVMTKSTSSPKIFNFTVKFNIPLGPQLELIQFRTVTTGIYFQLNKEFAGIDRDDSIKCQVLIISQSNRNKIIKSLILQVTSQKREYSLVDFDSSFSLYYTCKGVAYFESSTRCIVKHGTIDFDSKTVILQPIVQMPLRRFLKALWLPLRSVRRYDVAIYMKISREGYKCIKVFRIFINISANAVKSRKHLPPKCDGNIPVEDLGYFDEVGKSPINVILDMGLPLRMYENFKFSIFWKNAYGETLDNYHHFTPLPNENNGMISNKFTDINWDNYEEIKNDISPMVQSELSKNYTNPFKDKESKFFNLGFIDVLSSVSSVNISKIPANSVSDISTLYKVCEKSGCSKNFSPFFYAISKVCMPDSEKIEIMQIPMKKDVKNSIGQLEFSANNDKLCFDVSWKISNYPYSTTPAMFAVEITDDTSEKCVSLYILYCRTCNGIYINNTINRAEKILKSLKKICTKYYQYHDQYDAVDSSISFLTERMTSYKIFTATLYAFDDENKFISPRTKGKSLTANIWLTHGNTIIGSICAVIITGLFAMLILCCIHLSRDPNGNSKKKVSEDDNMYEQDENV